MQNIVPCCCGPVCSPCNIPTKNLTITYVSGTTTLTATLVYNTLVPNQWCSACSLPGQLLTNYNFYCQLGSFRFDYSTWDTEFDCFSGGVGPNSCSYPGVYGSQLLLVDYTCVPFHVHFRSDGTHCFAVSTDFYIDE
jgi:hypothetical protein